ncbi:RNA polymerase sigma factor [Paenibacillus sp. CMAA1364]
MNFEEIYDLYFQEVFLYIKSISKNESTAEEITQEAFFKALKAIESLGLSNLLCKLF